MQIIDHRIRKLTVPVDPPLVDARAGTDAVGVLYLELETDTGHTGVGIDDDLSGLPPAVLKERFGRTADAVTGESPFSLVERSGRADDPAAMPYGPNRFRKLLDVAVWDLCGKAVGLPVYELLGGADPDVRAYASGVGFDQPPGTLEAIYEPYADLGVTAAKVKVGYPDPETDLDRLRTVRDVLGADVTLMADANGRWSPKETIRRVRAYRRAGFELEWIEDPTRPSATEGITRVVEGLPDTPVSTGEYVDFDGKRELLSAGASDVLNLRTGLFSVSRHAAALAASYGIPVQVGQSLGDVGAHLAAALPNCEFVEFRLRPWDTLSDGGVSVEDGRVVVPDTPGHGIELPEATIREYAAA